jgi:hypothetical protein
MMNINLSLVTNLALFLFVMTIMMAMRLSLIVKRIELCAKPV